MHRYLLLLLLPLFVLLSACTQQERVYKIAFSNCGLNEWSSQLTSEMLREADLHSNVHLEVRASNHNTADQIADIDYFMSKGIDLLIVAPNESEALSPVIEKIYDQGIPVVLVDRTISSKKYTARIGVDNYEFGVTAAEFANRRLLGRGQLIGISGTPTSSPAKERTRGFVETLQHYPGLEFLTEVNADWDRDLARQKADSLFYVYPDVDMVICHNDVMAMGVWEALQRHTEITHPVLIFGTDGLYGPNLGIDQVVAGRLDATVVNPPGGDEAIRLSLDILEGRSYQRENLLPSIFVDASNARVMQLQGSQIDRLNDRLVGMNSAMADTYSRVHDQRTMLIIAIVVLLFVVVLLIAASIVNRRQVRLNAVLERQKSRLQEQTTLLSQQRDQMAELSRQAEAATKAKLAFFTNVSHDFRTPVTLIADPIRQLSEDCSNLTPKQKQLLDVMQRNTSVLLRLIQQVLDFRKFESGRMPLAFSRFNIADELRTWTAGFNQLAVTRSIDFKVNIDTDAEDYMIVADLVKCERIVYNLYSNAFKFTPEGGCITAHLYPDVSADGKETPGYSFSVSDTGIGLSSENIKHVFETFYQVDEHQVGSGLGLALCKAFVEMHHGVIDVSSNEGCGTTFHFFLPRRQNAAREVSASMTEVQVDTAADPLYQACLVETSQESLATDEESILNDNRDTLLVIDDNSDMRSYIAISLQSEYRIIEAANGEEGIRQAQRYVPNVIICDVMMPIMNGLDCCRHLKGDVRTSHIPVLMLTAYALDDQRIAGYDCGADAYLTKPFSAEVVRARIRNLIDNRTHLQIRGDITNELAKSAINTVDKSFTTRLHNYVHEHLSDNDLDVEQLSSELGLSRVQLYRKVKSITGYAPNELVRIARLKRAMELLSQTEKSVSEVAFEVGFSSSSYFAKCYRDFFGESPTDTARKK